MGVLGKDINNNTIVLPYGSQEKKLYDTFVIPWRAKGQTLI